jgi:hypothetical protein
MGEETNFDSLENEFREIRDELKEILYDIRVYLMEAQSPIPNDLVKEKLREELKAERG